MHLYHVVPPDMRGTILYPLNELKFRYPDLYARKVKKYEGREHILQRRIPQLRNSLWNDLLFFTAVSPGAMREAWEAAGVPYRHTHFFRFELSKFDLSVAGAWLWRGPRDAYYSGFYLREWEKYTAIPQSSIEYWRRELQGGRKPLMFLYVPHILYKGALDTTHAEIVMA